MDVLLSLNLLVRPEAKYFSLFSFVTPRIKRKILLAIFENSQPYKIKSH